MKPTLLPLLLTPLAACGSASNEPPPREVTPLAIPSQASAIAVPISARLADLEKIANRVVPATLASIDRQEPALRTLVSRLETELPREIGKLHPQEKLAGAWSKAFTALSINRENPPVWLRLTPQELRFRRYHIENGLLTLELGATALTETFVGQRPENPVTKPLPPPVPRQIAPDTGFRFYMPVIADYAELEPVLAKALDKLEKKPMTLPGIGVVEPDFGKVTLYPSGDGRLAIGLAMAVAAPGRWIDARGTIWATAKPFNHRGSQRVEVHDLQIAGNGSGASFRLLLAVAQGPAVQAEIGKALSQNFARDYSKLLGKAGAAIAEKRLGDFVLSAHIDRVQNGIVYPAGQGLFMPVAAEGTAALRYAPLRKI